MAEFPYKITLTKTEALILFEFLSRFKDSNKLEIVDTAEEIVLWKILGNLESNLVEPFTKDYIEILEAARSTIKREKGYDD